MEVSDPMTIYYDNLSNIQLARNPVFHAGPSTLRCNIILFASMSFLVKLNMSMFRRIGILAISSPNPFSWTSCDNSLVSLGCNTSTLSRYYARACRMRQDHRGSWTREQMGKTGMSEVEEINEVEEID